VGVNTGITCYTDFACSGHQKRQKHDGAGYFGAEEQDCQRQADREVTG